MNQIDKELYKTVYLEKRCPECGNEAKQTEKDTSTGRDLRCYSCSVCEWWEYIDVGIAFWKALELPEPLDWGSD